MYKIKRRSTVLLKYSFGAIVAICSLAAHSSPNSQLTPLSSDQQGGVQAYLTMYPNMSKAAAEKVVRGRLVRSDFLRDIGKSERKTFGGSRFDAQTNTQYIYATNIDSKARLLAQAYDRKLEIVVELVPYSYVELETAANAINAARTEREALTQALFAIADSNTNRVAVIVKNDVDAATARRRFANDSRVLVEKQLESVEAACSTRNDCGAPLRSGVNIGHDPDGPGYRRAYTDCTMGFTARASDGSRWALTAGHCGDGLQLSCGSYNPDGCWGHGQQYIGPEREVLYYGNIDVLRVRMDNPYWRNSPGGYMYNSANPNVLVEVDDHVEERYQIQIDDWVCFQGRRNGETGNNPCGLVKDLTGSYGLVQVNGFAICAGDSGGGVYSPNPKSGGLNGRTAFGLIARVSSFDHCHMATPNVYTLFSALPDIYDEWDRLTTAIIRVETR